MCIRDRKGQRYKLHYPLPMTINNLMWTKQTSAEELRYKFSLYKESWIKTSNFEAADILFKGPLGVKKMFPDLIELDFYDQDPYNPMAETQYGMIYYMDYEENEFVVKILLRANKTSVIQIGCPTRLIDRGEYLLQTLEFLYRA
eukprot:TRINITY_DN28209_c0_g1_i1.p2 TRINITY_DN28209_c0_g1~~TRINITY_DN28209_c0_g1_i1.p2  ORF type:complete len:164 (+),score=46.08 TRINITY_DN28209_c0_g1_i1:62-493(+)